MRIGFNEATAKGCSNLETDIKLCAWAGFDYIELRLDMIEQYLYSHCLEDIIVLLEMHKIIPHALNAVYTSSELFKNNGSRDRDKRFLSEFVKACKWARQLGSRHLIVVPPMNPSGFKIPYKGSKEQALEDCIRIMRRLSELAGLNEVNLCLEPVGAPKSSIRTARDADLVIRAVDRPNTGVVLDAYNLYMAYMDSRFEEIRLLDKEKIFAVHINNADSAEPSLEARRFCDSGVIDLAAFLRELKAKDYSGMVSVETFRPEYWEISPEVIIPLAYSTTRKILVENNCLE